MIRSSLASLVLILSLTNLCAQSMPFDMAPERPAPAVVPEASEGVAQPAAEAPSALPKEFRRGLLPSGDLSLRGENASRSWIIHLTEQQAEAPVRLHLGYSNAVVVAPEASRLQVLLNDATVIETSIRSAEGVTNLEAEIPSGLLRAGRNEFSLRVNQRHRTDCTIQSTYELWTTIKAAQTFLTSTDENSQKLSTVDDLRTIAPDPTGKATIAIVAPGMARGDIGADIMKLAQAIALHVPLPDLNYVVEAAPSSAQDNASLFVFLGTNEELEPLGINLRTKGEDGPVAGFTERRGGAPTFVISGRSRSEWLSALDQLLAPVDRVAGTQRQALVTETWQTPNAPMIYGARELTFSELGVQSQQFSGRRFTTGFQFAIPADYYADSYGEAKILLDAAYAPNVLPGSLVNVYVNGSIAVSMPLNETRGALLKQVPIRLTTRHFKPGLNEVAIVADLASAEDEACLAVAGPGDEPRFAIFSTSRFVVPAFARIGQRPNLAALGGTGYPFGQSKDHVPIFLERNDAASLSVTADLLARMAISAGRAFPVTFTNSIDATRDRDAIFVGSISAIPSTVLGQVNVSEESRSFWGTSHGRAPGGADATQIDAEAWRRQMEQSTWMSEIDDWLQRTFDLNLRSLRFAPLSEAAFVPSQPAQVLLAQGSNPARNGVWTLVTAPDSAMLRDGVNALTRLPNWNQLSGRLATLDTDLQTISALPVTSQSFIETQPFSVGNFRLIIANWLSANILSYSLVLVGACTLLGIATSMLLSRLGRRN